MDDGTFVSPSACRVDAIDDTDQVPRRSQHHMSNRRNASPASRPHFMTQGMWFAWLLRGDIRQGSAPDDPEAQREFVAWWLFWGRAAYPKWHWGSDQAVVAMQLVTTANGLTCPRLLRRLHASRPDLQHAFRLHDEESLAEFFCWYRVYGSLELDAAPELPAMCLAVTESPSQRQPWSARGLQVPRIAVALAHRNSGMLSGACGDSPGKARLVADWYDKYGRHLLPTPTEVPAPLAAAQRRRRQGGGVNLVGFVRGQFGLGEDVRMASVALEAAGVAHVLVDVPAGAAVPQQDNSLVHRLSERLPYNVTIYACRRSTRRFCISPGVQGVLPDNTEIGYWPLGLACIRSPIHAV